MDRRKVILAGVAAAALVAAGTGGHAVVHAVTHSAPSTASITVPSGSGYTPQSWAAALLAAGGWPGTACNLGAITAWENTEGGNWNNSATYNPLNTTYDDNGAWETDGRVTATINSHGVRAYDSWQTGFTATVTVLDNGLYGPILAALSAGSSAQAVADAVGSSPWGTAPFQATCN